MPGAPGTGVCEYSADCECKAFVSTPPPIIPHKWTGNDDGETWEVVVEHDCMEAGQPFVVTVEVSTETAGVKVNGFSQLTPAEAREMASALMVYAFFADKENRA